jgi:hypothetical protein
MELTDLLLSDDQIKTICTLTIVRAQWDSCGECTSCGWHASLNEYELPGDIEVDW